MNIDSIIKMYIILILISKTRTTFEEELILQISHEELVQEVLCKFIKVTL